MLHSCRAAGRDHRAVRRVAYQADIPTGLALMKFLVMLVVGAATFCALGFAVTAVTPNADAAAPIVNATILPLLFLSGVFIPLGDNAPAWIIWIGRFFPSATSRRHAGRFPRNDLPPERRASRLSVGIGGLFLAVRSFSWEPRV